MTTAPAPQPAPADPRSPLSWLSAAGRLVGNLSLRFWLLLMLVYSGRAMMPLLPADVTNADRSGFVLGAFEFLVRFWMPYLFLRAMAGDANPARPGVPFLWFAVVAILFALIESLSVTLAHAVFLTGAMEPTRQNGLRLFFAMDLLVLLATVRLLPLYAGTATARLSPVDMRWWTGLRGGALALFVAMAGVLALGTVLHRLLPGVAPVLDPAVIGMLHLRQALEAATFLLTLGLALAACNRCLRLPSPEPAR